MQSSIIKKEFVTVSNKLKDNVVQHKRLNADFNSQHMHMSQMGTRTAVRKNL